MAQNEEKYKRLPGRSGAYISWFDPSRYQLWLGEDHLLHLSWTNFSESYKRFYLKDIQTIVLSRTMRGRIINIVLGILLLISALLCWPLALGAGVTIQVYVFGTLAPMFAILLGWNTLFGPTCRCCLHTAVQVEELPSLGRIRSARKTFVILQLAVEAAQGKLTAEDLDVSSEKQTMHQASAHALPAISAASSKEAVPLKHENGKAHMFLFALMPIGAATSLADIFYRHSIKDMFDMIFFLATLLIAIVALIRQRDSDLPSDLKRTTWVVLWIMIASFFIGYSLAIGYMISRGGMMTSADPYELMFASPAFKSYIAIQAIVFAAAGLIGLVQLSRFRSSYADSKATDPKADLYEKDPSDEG